MFKSWGTSGAHLRKWVGRNSNPDPVNDEYSAPALQAFSEIFQASRLLFRC